MYYQYEYEASSGWTAGSNLVLGDVYITVSWVFVILLALAAFALTLFAAITMKKGRVFGLIASVFPPVGVVASWVMVLFWKTLDFGHLAITVRAGSQKAAESLWNQQMIEATVHHLLPGALLYWITSLAVSFALLVSAIYMVILFRSRVKGLAIVAFICTILHMFLMQPVPLFWYFEWFGMESWIVYLVWEAIYYMSFMLPFVLIGAQGLINLILNIKDKRSGKRKKVSEIEALEAEIAEMAEVEQTEQAAEDNAEDAAEESEESDEVAEGTEEAEAPMDEESALIREIFSNQQPTMFHDIPVMRENLNKEEASADSDHE